MRMSFHLPIQRNVHFVGREAPLKQIHEYLFAPEETENGDKSRVVVLYGLGGAGKTQLSAAYSFAHQKDFDAVLWVDAADQINTLLSFQEIAHRLLDSLSALHGGGEEAPLVISLRSLEGKLLNPRSTRPAADMEVLPKLAHAVVDLLESTTETFTWLLVLDNVDNLADNPLSRFLPQSKRGKIIITTRLTAVTKFGYPIQIGEIEPSAAVKILLRNACLRNVTSSGKYSYMMARCDES